MAESGDADWSSYERALQCVKEEVNECSDLFSGACWERPSPGRGHILWADDRSQCSDSPILLPGFNLMHRGVLITAYALFLSWLFLGVAISSDTFAGTIENITSMTKRVKRRHPHTGETIEVEEKVWNWVVANISLMAFGTSAPETLLSIIETSTQLGKRQGQLGASTIVGSAAYNFFLIPGICSAALPPGQFKRLSHLHVFLTTATWSLWAYIWIFLVLSVISPGEVELWEAFVTLAFFPAMLIIAYLVDRMPSLLQTWFRRGQAVLPYDVESLTHGGHDGTQLGGSGSGNCRPAPAGVTCSINPVAPGHTASPLVPKQQHSILYYRMMIVRLLAGETKTPEMRAFLHDNPSKEEAGSDALESPSHQFIEKAEQEQAAPPGSCKLGFGSLHYSVVEAARVARLTVCRYGESLESPVTVAFATRDGTAIQGIDYRAAQGVLKFAPGEVEKQIEVSIIDDDMSEPDVTFNVVLSEARGTSGAVIVQDSVPVTIVDDDEGGMLMFELPTKEVSMSESFVELCVIRKNGTDGCVTVECATKDGTGPAARAGYHYKETRQLLVFDPGEVLARVRIPLLANGNSDASPSGLLAFKVELSNPLGGAVLGRRSVCRVILVPPYNTKMTHNSKVAEKGGAGEKYSLWEGYKRRTKEALLPDLNDGSDFMWFDIMLHYISISWKLICVPIPPSEYKSGYPAFIGALIVLVGVVYCTKEVATLLGCELTLSQTMTGLSLVSFGTSLPDTFASRFAALHDDTADAAIGNITSSNSANVFLGMGVPWIIASSFYLSRGEKFQVDAGALGFTLVLWCAGFVAMMAWLMFRRYQGGELGGSKTTQIAHMGWSIFLWIFFLVLSGVHNYNHFEANVSHDPS